MLSYEELKNNDQIKSIITKEIESIQELLLSQFNFQKYITIYIEEVSTTFVNEEVFKNMLLTSLDSASLQIGTNITDLSNLNNILDIISTKQTALGKNVEQYNKLYSKVEKNLTIVKEILQRIATSFEQLSTISTKTVESSPERKAKLEEAKKGIMGPEKKEELPKNISRDIRKIEDHTSSDLLCFFPKSDNDILAITTVQDSYKVIFNQDVATVSIEEENFNFSLKTVGVQISNSENIMLISRENAGYFIMTNLPVEVPPFIKVSRINQRNNNFIEIGVNHTNLCVSVNNNELTFSDEFETTDTTDITKTETSNPAINIQAPVETVSTNMNVQIPAAPVTTNTNVQIPATPVSTDPIMQAPVTQPTQQVLTSQVAQPSEVTAKKDDGIDFMKDNNTLIISEKDNQVILPYKLSDVEKQYQKNGKKKYSSVQDLIQNEYIIPTENFKNPMKSRFREAYQLIKKKEHGHLKEAIELGFELMFQSNLNPAIIAACKNLKELDIYLDCLDDNELDKFSCFDIVYNVPPTKKKK